MREWEEEGWSGDPRAVEAGCWNSGKQQNVCRAGVFGDLESHIKSRYLCCLESYTRPPCRWRRSSNLAKDLPPPPVDAAQPAGEGRRWRSRSPRPLRGMARGPPPPEERWQLGGDDDAGDRWEMEVDAEGL